MNKNLIKLNKANEFFVGKTKRILNAINFMQDQLAKNKWEDHMVCDVETKLAIRDELVRHFSSLVVVDTVLKNKDATDLVSLVIDALVQNRSKMSGCCHDCHINVYDEWEYDYFLHEEVWDKATKDDTDKFFCVLCIEKRLGRELKSKDFDWEVPLNYIDGERSPILEARMIAE